MKIIIKTKNIELNQALRDWVDKKIGPLEKFMPVFQDEDYVNSFFGKEKPTVEAWVEIGRDSFHHHKGLVYRAEAQLHFPKKNLRAESYSKYLRAAVTKVKDNLQRQIKQYKNKAAARRKRKERASKKIIRLASSAKFNKKKGSRIRDEGI